MQALLNASMNASPACVPRAELPVAPNVDQASSKSAASDSGRASGRWTKDEHEEFLRCLQIYGREWKKTSERITTRGPPASAAKFLKRRSF